MHREAERKKKCSQASHPRLAVPVQWTGSQLEDIAGGTALADPTRQAIGVAAADFDGDGMEEVGGLGGKVWQERWMMVCHI